MLTGWLRVQLNELGFTKGVLLVPNESLEVLLCMTASLIIFTTADVGRDLVPILSVSLQSL